MTGYIVLGIGAMLIGTGVIVMVVTLLTASGAKKKIEKRMNEKY